ncbi:MAG TPA: radical SAM family heme chaperone HemW [Chitinophagaceae bacterium]
MAGIYIHIPFCKQACNYCNFHFVTSLNRKNELLNVLLNEIRLQKNYVADENIETIYIGGGTPSLLNKEELQQLVNQVKNNYVITHDAEITLEANPDDITNDVLMNWKQIGINRLSIGIQSFFEEDLLWMNRAHNARQARQCIELAQKNGFENITIDLIYGTPLLTDEKWKQNVETAVAYGIPHLSCYALTIEPKTPLHKMIREHKKQDIDTDQQARQFLLLMDWMQAAGFEHYEISNFAKPGFRSRHNSSYWQGKKYIGIGPSAHSFNGHSRQWNISNNNIYIGSLKEEKIPFELEELTPVQQLNEYIMTSLRTSEGINILSIKNKWGEKMAEKILSKIDAFIQQNKMTKNKDHLQLTKEGKLLADGIAADLFED